jgi:hypothetical protein
MFSKDITTSDAFREMPTSSQALYFHLGMEADDDGFLDNYRGLMRAVNATEDDLRILVAKRFLIVFPSKVIVVKHWLINNTVRKDRYNETKHLEEKRALIVKENGAYTEVSDGLPDGNQTATQYRIEEDRKEELGDSEDGIRRVVPSFSGEGETEERPKVERRTKDKEAIYRLFSSKEQPWWRHAQQKKAALSLFDLVGVEKVRAGLKLMSEHTDDRYCPQASTPFEYEEKLPLLARYAKKQGL